MCGGERGEMCYVYCDNVEIKIPRSSGDSKCLTGVLVSEKKHQTVVYVLEADFIAEWWLSHADVGQQNALAAFLWVVFVMHGRRIWARQIGSFARREAAPVIFWAACSSQCATEMRAFPSSSHLINEANALAGILHWHTNSLCPGGHKLLDSNGFLSAR